MAVNDLIGQYPLSTNEYFTIIHASEIVFFQQQENIKEYSGSDYQFFIKNLIQFNNDGQSKSCLLQKYELIFSY